MLEETIKLVAQEAPSEDYQLALLAAAMLLELAVQGFGNAGSVLARFSELSVDEATLAFHDARQPTWADLSSTPGGDDDDDPSEAMAVDSEEASQAEQTGLLSKGCELSELTCIALA